jgi:type IV pilus assembly protein PilV
MLEVLITMLVIAGALLGTAGMQTYALKVTQGGQFRMQAVILASDLLERIEANNAGAVAGAYTATMPVLPEPKDCAASACTAADMAAYDLKAFERNLAALLPGASAVVTIDGAGPWVYTVQVMWQERSFRSRSTTSASNAQTETFSYSVSRRIYNRAAVV